MPRTYTKVEPLLRFRSKRKLSTEHIYEGTPCWEWTASIDKDGYASSFRPGGRDDGNAKPHRWSYEHFIGPIPDRLVIDHLCRVRHCVSPLHLEPVTASINTLRGGNSIKTHCKRGHPLSGDNLYVTMNKTKQTPMRRCNACHAQHQREYISRRDAA